MTPEKPEAVNMGTGGATTPPPPVCHRPYGKPCGCPDCEAYADWLSQRMREEEGK